LFLGGGAESSPPKKMLGINTAPGAQIVRYTRTQNAQLICGFSSHRHDKTVLPVSCLAFTRCELAFIEVRFPDCVLCGNTQIRRGSRILQGRVSNPSEKGTGGRAPPDYFDPCYWNQTMFLASEEIVGARRSYDI